jgi:hypothetical protein
VRARHACADPLARPQDGSPLSQLSATDRDESTDEAIGDWSCWVARGYCLYFTHVNRRKHTIFDEPSQFLLTSDPR